MGNSDLCLKEPLDTHKNRGGKKYKIHLMVKDATGTTTFVLFNKQAENLLDTSANKLISSKRYLYQATANDKVSSKVHKFTFINNDEESCEGMGNKKEKLLPSKHCTT
ncbi:hypothetical protein Syun_014530 [Stephania yunnanensis]|uniref:Replication factor A C-terminal domain-containing protein n=1 Tax=Stephania yunnanensis TaxID=152371 RepID=A0AAP0JKC2_9MAGN